VLAALSVSFIALYSGNGKPSCGAATGCPAGIAEQFLLCGVGAALL